MGSRELEFIAHVCEERRDNVPTGPEDPELLVDVVAVALTDETLTIEERLVKAGAVLMYAYECVTPERGATI